jgi:hypothetical protein
MQYGPFVFWGKQKQFQRFLELPSKTTATFELALSGEAPEAELEEYGWRVRSARSVSMTPDDYRRYLASSGAEFSVAKDIYVATNSGWFSERTACYLASGCPAIVQDTGFSKFLPRGPGLHPFRRIEEASEAVERVTADYETESAGARKIAERYFDSQVVLGDLLNIVKI